MKPHDETHSLLAQLHVPQARTAHCEAIIAAARQHPRRSLAWLDALRTLRAHLYVPQMRYAIMASVVGAFILIGLAGNALRDNTQQTRIAANELLDDVDFAEEHWQENFLTFAGGY